LLKKHGVKIEDDDHSDEHHEPTPSEHYGSSRALSLEVPRNPKTDRGLIFTDKVNSRYVEKYVQTLAP
jgi:hypothetical protein